MFVRPPVSAKKWVQVLQTPQAHSPKPPPSIHPSTYPLTSHHPKKKRKTEKTFKRVHQPNPYKCTKNVARFHTAKVQHVFELCNPKRKKERKKNTKP